MAVADSCCGVAVRGVIQEDVGLAIAVQIANVGEVVAGADGQRSEGEATRAVTEAEERQRTKRFMAASTRRKCYYGALRISIL